MNNILGICPWIFEYKLAIEKLVRTTIAIYLHFTLLSYSAKNKNPETIIIHEYHSSMYRKWIKKIHFGGFLDVEKTAIELLRYVL